MTRVRASIAKCMLCTEGKGGPSPSQVATRSVASRAIRLRHQTLMMPPSPALSAPPPIAQTESCGGPPPSTRKTDGPMLWPPTKTLPSCEALTTISAPLFVASASPTLLISSPPGWHHAAHAVDESDRMSHRATVPSRMPHAASFGSLACNATLVTAVADGPLRQSGVAQRPDGVTPHSCSVVSHEPESTPAAPKARPDTPALCARRNASVTRSRPTEYSKTSPSHVPAHSKSSPGSCTHDDRCDPPPTSAQRKRRRRRGQYTRTVLPPVAHTIGRDEARRAVVHCPRAQRARPPHLRFPESG
eukprot:scaffold21818_cov28-Tisochrysis_lutea.AAC.3